jgi:ubiquinone/menaquinone biosynthesis C-methylase UbiE
MGSLKEDVKEYWNRASCGTEYIQAKKYTKDYFQEVERHRYHVEPEIFAFAQFSRWHSKKVLEVGIGAGTDFVQWVRSGAYAYGIDLTQEAVLNTQKRLALEGLTAREVKVSDAECLPYADNMFDLVYSWGVIHHSPDTELCLAEIIRVTKPGGTIKVMVYNKNSLFAFYRYLLAGLFKGKPVSSWNDILFHHQESTGTKAYTRKELQTMLQRYPVSVRKMHAPVTYHDMLHYKSRIFRWCAYVAACFFGYNSVGWFMMIELEKSR